MTVGSSGVPPPETRDAVRAVDRAHGAYVNAPMVPLSASEMREARHRAVIASAQTVADKQAKREGEAIVVAVLMIVVALIAVFDLVLLTVGLR